MNPALLRLWSEPVPRHRVEAERLVTSPGAQEDGKDRPFAYVQIILADASPPDRR